MGSDAIALPALEWMAGPGAAVARVVAVFTQPDRPAGRGQRVRPNAIKLWAEERGLPVHQPEKFSATDREALAAATPDVTLVMAYGHLLRPPVIDTPRLGTLNLHASLLPRYRGASPIQAAVAEGERETGVALMRIVAALDAGPVAATERVPIGPLDTSTEVAARLAQACVPLLARSLPALAAGRLEFREQDAAAATYCRRLEKADGVLDFAAGAATLAARINGLMPWPGCTVEIAGQVIRCGLADVASAEPAAAAPGTVLGSDAAGLLVATGAGVLRLRRWQRPGGKLLPAGEFLRGFPVAPGTVLASRPMPGLVRRA